MSENNQVIFKSRSGQVIDVSALIATTNDPNIVLNNLQLDTWDRHNFMYKFAEVNEAKGKKGGSCNITQCQKKGASCYNGGMDAYYCSKCWDDIYSSATYHGAVPQDWIKQEYRQEDHHYVYGAEGGIQDLQNLVSNVSDAVPEKREYRGDTHKDALFSGFVDNSHIIGRDRSHNPWVRGGPKVGRNSECPCGSGVKFKKCCGGSLG